MIVYIDMDDVLCDFSGAYRKALEKYPTIQYPQSQLDFFRRLDPLPGAVESVRKLIASEFFEPYILSAPSCRNPLSYMEKRIWIEEYFGYPFVKRLILTTQKNLLKGDLLIDDNIAGKGQDQFEGRIIHFGSAEYPDWDSVVMELESIDGE